jgi:hypothetical protein
VFQKHNDPEADFLLMEDEPHPEIVCFSAKYPVMTIVSDHDINW